MPNFRNKQPKIKDDNTLECGNYSQLFPNTPIYEGAKGIIVNRGSNLTNCVFPPDTVFNCKRPVQIDFCQHRHPNMGLPDEGGVLDICKHTNDENKIVVEGVKIGYVRGDIILG